VPSIAPFVKAVIATVVALAVSNVKNGIKTIYATLLLLILSSSATRPITDTANPIKNHDIIFASFPD